MNNSLAKYRRIKKFLQSDLAKKINVSDPSYISYEKGHRAIPSDVLLDLCNVLEVTPNDIFNYKYKNEEYILTPRRFYSLSTEEGLICENNKYDFLYGLENIEVENDYFYLKTTSEFNSHTIVIPKNAILLIGIINPYLYNNQSICLLNHHREHYFLSEIYVNIYTKEVTYFYQNKPVTKQVDEFNAYVLVGTVKKVIIDL